MGFDYRAYTWLWKQTLGRHKQNLCAPGPRGKEQWPHKRMIRLACECPGVSSGGVSWQWPAARSEALNIRVHAQVLLKEIAIVFITLTIVWFQVTEQGGNTSTEKWIKDLLSMTPPTRTRPSFPKSQSFPSESFHKPLILTNQRVDRIKTTITEN